MSPAEWAHYERCAADACARCDGIARQLDGESGPVPVQVLSPSDLKTLRVTERLAFLKAAVHQLSPSQVAQLYGIRRSGGGTEATGRSDRQLARDLKAIGYRRSQRNDEITFEARSTT